jgi:hypothetical protein
MELNREQLAILDHTAHRAAGGFYCGDSPDMRALVAAGLMESAGRIGGVYTALHVGEYDELPMSVKCACANGGKKK